MAYLLIGVGGLGCEIAKCVASSPSSMLPELQTLHLVDFDTIEVSNLNRQLLFNSKHVGMSKAEVAKQIIRSLNPDIEVICHISSIYDSKFDQDFFKKMKLVINALDNNKARSYVCKMCVDSGTSLIDGGSAGFLGQVRWFLNGGDTECFNCYPTPDKKTYANCTIRNNPTEFVHCVVWAKHLFHTLFGEDYSANDFFDLNLSESQHIGFLEQMFDRIYYANIKKLEEELSYTKPVKFKPIKYTEATNNTKINDFTNSFINLCRHFYQLKESSDQLMTWTKDDDEMVKFVYSAANLRAYIFDLPFKSEFETKTIAGNIIPSVVTTNAIVSGIMLMEIDKYFNGDLKSLRNSYVCSSSAGGHYINPVFIPNANEDCLYCQKKLPIYYISCNFQLKIAATVIPFLQKHLNMENIEIMDDRGNIIVSVDDEIHEIDQITLGNYNSNVKLICNDFEKCLEIELIVNDKADIEHFIINDCEIFAAQNENQTDAKKLKI